MVTKTVSKDVKTAAHDNSETGAGKIGNASQGTVEERNPPSNTKSSNKATSAESKSNEKRGAVQSSKGKSKPEKMQTKKPSQKKAAGNGRTNVTADKKIKLAATCYHYYRHFLKDALRADAPSSRFKKAEDSYDGHIVILQSEKAKGLKALEKWKKENPEAKELFWDVKK